MNENTNKVRWEAFLGEHLWQRIRWAKPWSLVKPQLQTSYHLFPSPLWLPISWGIYAPLRPGAFLISTRLGKALRGKVLAKLGGKLNWTVCGCWGWENRVGLYCFSIKCILFAVHVGRTCFEEVQISTASEWKGVIVIQRDDFAQTSLVFMVCNQSYPSLSGIMLI